MTTHWTELAITVPAAHIEPAGEIAHMAVPYGIYIEDYTDLEQGAQEIAGIDLIDEALLAKDRTLGIVHIYLSPQDNPTEAVAWLSERYTAANIPHEIETKLCKNEDWENNWKAYFHPLSVGQKLLIQPAWQPPADPDGRAVLLLEPGLAFGSGSHATTQLCMQMLEQYVTPGCTVLDIGCGSGILSIAAVLLGAGTALGVDIDPMAVQNARENAARNGQAEPQVQFTQGDLTRDITGRFDMIVSNIVADAIIALAPCVRRFLKPGGAWLSSGIIDTRAEEVITALQHENFTIDQMQMQEGWVCITCKV